MKKQTVVDMDQGLQVLQTAGPEAFVIFFLLEAAEPTDKLKVTGIATQVNLPVEVVHRACCKLGLLNLGIEDDTSPTKDSTTPD